MLLKLAESGIAGIFHDEARTWHLLRIWEFWGSAKHSHFTYTPEKKQMYKEWEGHVIGNLTELQKHVYEWNLAEGHAYGQEVQKSVKLFPIFLAQTSMSHV